VQRPVRGHCRRGTKTDRKMKRHTFICASLALAMAVPMACSQDDNAGTGPASPADAKHTPMTFSVAHPADKTRATDAGFETGDTIGLFVAAADAPLEIGGNLVNNEPLTLAAGTWTPRRSLYWDDGTYNAYAYYPYTTPVSSIDNMPFSVSRNQGAMESDGMDGYEASDLLYARTSGVSASASPIRLTFRHIMSKITVRLIKGEDFEGEMPTDAKVYVHNTVPSATIDLGVGVATRDVYGKRATITAKQQSVYTYSAIIVPQRIDNRTPLIEVIMKGVSYIFESKFQFKPGTEHLVNLVISDNPDKVKIEVGGEIQDWQ